MPKTEYDDSNDNAYLLLKQQLEIVHKLKMDLKKRGNGEGPFLTYRLDANKFIILYPKQTKAEVHGEWDDETMGLVAKLNGTTKLPERATL